MDSGLDCPNCKRGYLLKDGHTSWDVPDDRERTKFRFAQQLRCQTCKTIVIIEQSATVITKGG